MLGGLLEETLKQSLLILGPDWLCGFLGRLIALALPALTVAGFAFPLIMRAVMQLCGVHPAAGHRGEEIPTFPGER